MTRQIYIEKFLRQIYGDFQSDDAAITVNLVNVWLSEGIALAAKQNYKDNIAIDGIKYINNGFYSTFKGISITQDENNLWKASLPEIPVGIGANEGVSTIQLKDSTTNQVTLPFIPLSENQKTYYQTMRPIPNKILYYYEGKIVYMVSTLLLNLYTLSVTMVSGGNSSDLSSELNVPSDYLPVIDAYLLQQLNIQRSQPQDVQNEGLDAIKTI